MEHWLEHKTKVTAEPFVATNLGPINFPATVSPVHFIKLELLDAKEKLVSSNFYWRAPLEHPDDFTALNKMAAVKLEANAAIADAEGRRTVTVTLHNPSKNVALMTHVQLRREKSGERVLPVYYSDNYVSLVGGETRTIKIEADIEPVQRRGRAGCGGRMERDG